MVKALEPGSVGFLEQNVTQNTVWYKGNLKPLEGKLILNVCYGFKTSMFHPRATKTV